MAGLLPGDPLQHEMYEGASYKFRQDKAEENGHGYLSMKEIEEYWISRGLHLRMTVVSL